VHFQTQIASTHRAGTQYDLAKDWDTGCESLSAVIENLYTTECTVVIQVQQVV